MPVKPAMSKGATDSLLGVVAKPAPQEGKQQPAAAASYMEVARRLAGAPAVKTFTKRAQPEAVATALKGKRQPRPHGDAGAIAVAISAYLPPAKIQPASPVGTAHAATVAGGVGVYSPLQPVQQAPTVAEQTGKTQQPVQQAPTVAEQTGKTQQPVQQAATVAEQTGKTQQPQAPQQTQAAVAGVVQPRSGRALVQDSLRQPTVQLPQQDPAVQTSAEVLAAGKTLAFHGSSKSPLPASATGKIGPPGAAATVPATPTTPATPPPQFASTIGPGMPQLVLGLPVTAPSGAGREVWSPPQPVALSDLQQVVYHMSRSAELPATMSVALEPSSLGRIQLQVQVVGAHIEVHIAAEQPATLAMVQDQLGSLGSQLMGDLGGGKAGGWRPPAPDSASSQPAPEPVPLVRPSPSRLGSVDLIL